MSQVNATKKKRTREGVVVSDKMNQGFTVEISRLTQHPRFKKVIRQKIRYAVHDKENSAKIGDKVRIVETSPISKNKRWRLVKVLTK